MISLRMHELIQEQIRHHQAQQNYLNKVWHQYITTMEIPVAIRFQIYATSGWRTVSPHVPEFVRHNEPLYEYVLENFRDLATIDVNQLLLEYCDRHQVVLSEDMMNSAMKSGYTHFVNYI